MSPSVDYSAGAWPFPVQYVPAEGAEQLLDEFCEVTLVDNSKLAGTLVSFTPQKRTLSLQVSPSVGVEHLDFDRILTLRLTHAVEIRRPQQRLTSDASKSISQA